MNRLNVKAYTTAITNAALNRRRALQVELAVGFAVILESGENQKLARVQLTEIYATVGYKCRASDDIDYKTIYRRITAAFTLYLFLGEAEIKSWAGNLSRGPLIDALIAGIEPLKLTTVNEVLEACKDAKHKEEGSARGRRPGVHIDTAHLHIVVPPTATKEELLEAASRLMKMAEAMMQPEELELELKKAA